MPRNITRTRLRVACIAWVVRVGGDDGLSPPTLICVVPWSEFPIVPFYPHYSHIACLGVRVQGLGCMVEGIGCRVCGVESGVRRWQCNERAVDSSVGTPMPPPAGELGSVKRMYE